LLQYKSQAFNAFMQFKSMFKLQFGLKIKSFQSNNAKEFLKLTPYLTQHGIFHHLTCPYAHEQNGSPKRKHRHITETGLTLLTQASLLVKFWGKAFLTATTLTNTLPTLILNNQSLYQVLFQKSSDYQFFWVFGCACFSLLCPYNEHKLDFWS